MSLRILDTLALLQQSNTVSLSMILFGYALTLLRCSIPSIFVKRSEKTANQHRVEPTLQTLNLPRTAKRPVTPAIDPVTDPTTDPATSTPPFVGVRSPNVVARASDIVVLSSDIVVPYSDDDSSWIVSPTPAGGVLNRALPLAIDDEARDASAGVIIAGGCRSREDVRGRRYTLLSESEEPPGVRTAVVECLLGLRLTGPGQVGRCWRASEDWCVAGAWRRWR